jgi:hypothetical protein
MTAWLLSWNPKRWQWKTFAQDRATTASGRLLKGAWSCANGAAARGDTVYLVRIGVEPRGIIARGIITKRPYQGPHYDSARRAKGETSQYVGINFDDIRDPAQDEFLSIRTVEREVDRDQIWKPQASGIAINNRAAKELKRRWSQLEKPTDLRAATPTSASLGRLGEGRSRKPGTLDRPVAYTNLCAYTIRHSLALEEFGRSAGPHRIPSKQKAWTTVARLIAEGRREGKIVPVVFAPAEGTLNIVACGNLLSVETGRRNAFTFANLRFLDPPLLKTDLKLRDGRGLSPDFIRDYAIWRTPASDRRIQESHLWARAAATKALHTQGSTGWGTTRAHSDYHRG